MDFLEGFFYGAGVASLGLFLLKVFDVVPLGWGTILLPTSGAYFLVLANLLVLGYKERYDK